MLARLIRLVVAFGVPLAAAYNGQWGLALGWSAVLVGLYAFSLAFLPWVPCLVCKGTGGRSHSWFLSLLWPSAYGNCWKCKGAKGRVRLGIRIFQPERAKRVELKHA